MSAWKIFGSELVWAGNGYTSVAAGIFLGVHYELSFGEAVFWTVALFVVQCLCLLNRYTAWIAVLAGSAYLAAFVALLSWVAGEHYHFAPTFCAVAGGLLGLAGGVSSYRDLIQEIRPRPEKN